MDPRLTPSSPLVKFPVVLLRYRCSFVLFILTASNLASFVTPLTSPWHDIRVKRAWDAVPHNWEFGSVSNLDPPPLGTTINLPCAQAPQRKRIDGHIIRGHHSKQSRARPPKHCPIRYIFTCAIESSDMVYICPRRRLPNSSCLTQTPSSLFTLGLHTITSRCPPSL